MCGTAGTEEHEGATMSHAASNGVEHLRELSSSYTLQIRQMAVGCSRYGH